MTRARSILTGPPLGSESTHTPRTRPQNQSSPPDAMNRGLDCAHVLGAPVHHIIPSTVKGTSPARIPSRADSPSLTISGTPRLRCSGLCLCESTQESPA